MEILWMSYYLSEEEMHWQNYMTEAESVLKKQKKQHPPGKGFLPDSLANPTPRKQKISKQSPRASMTQNLLPATPLWLLLLRNPDRLLKTQLWTLPRRNPIYLPGSPLPKK